MIPRDPLVRRLIQTACSHTGLSEGELLGQERGRYVSRVRFAIMHVAYAAGVGPYSTPHLGLLLGGRDHTTVLNGLRRAKEYLADGDAWFGDLVAALRKVAG